MIFKRRFNATFIVLLYSTFVASERRGEEFKVDVDDLQVVYSDPPEVVIKPPSRYLYSKEIAQCPPSASKMMLTILLQSLKWNDIGEKKKEKAIKKLSRFFLVPMNYIKVDEIHTPEMLEMLKHSINKSNNFLNTKETVGRIEFPIGCGDKLFPNSKSTAHKINEYVKSGYLQELSGLPIHWWNIWSKHIKSRVQRTKRDVDDPQEEFQGSGDVEEYDEYDEESDAHNEDTLPEDTFNEKVKSSTTSTTLAEKKSEEESNYDDEYDDDDENNLVDSSPAEKSTPSFESTIPRTPPPLITTPNEEDDDDEDETEELDASVLKILSSTLQPTTTVSTTLLPTTTIAATTGPSTTAYEVTPDNNDFTSSTIEPDYDDSDQNHKPFVNRRMKKLQATAGKTFTHKLEDSIFDDQEDGKNLDIQLLDKDSMPLSQHSWIRFNGVTREIYGLPLENDVSKHEFKLRATDRGGLTIDEIVDITVHQHKSLRSVNHEIFIQVTVENKYESAIDWQIRLIRGIVEALDDDSIGSIIVRDVKPNKHQSNFYTFVYSNDTLPKDRCPKPELDRLMTRLTKQALTNALRREITIRNVEKDLINSCAEVHTPRPVPSPPNTKNFPPTVRNAIDKINAIVGQLLVFEVPRDTFYDPEDLTDLKLTLLNQEDRSAIDATNWLQFDAKNQEFFGVPTLYDRSQGYVLVAEDKNGLIANDALIVDITNLHSKRDYSATFEYQLEIGMEQFQNPSIKRKFIERLQHYFGDATTDSIVIKSVKKVTYAGRTAVVVQNATLIYRDGCPTKDINSLKNRLVRQDGSVQDDFKQALGSEFNVQKISVSYAGKCASGDTYHHHDSDASPVDRPDEKETPIINQDVLITYVLPTAIILLMLLIALLIACLLYKRRNTGKMELGDEEERKSFRSKGIPVIFQDELDEKPEIVTKSPVILKDEKPPLLPQYNGMGQDGEDDNLDQYIPPQPLLMGSRESRGKSPVTPSYRKPPPYVSP